MGSVVLNWFEIKLHH